MAKRFSVQQIDHVEVRVPDVAEAAAWYERVLGLVPVPGIDWTAPLMISSDGGNTKIALFRGEPQGADEGWRRVAFKVSGSAFLEFLGRSEAAGLTNPDGSTLRARNVVDHDISWSIYFTDPVGNPLEVTTYDYDEVAHALDD